jgi:hypothetical protein
MKGQHPQAVTAETLFRELPTDNSNAGLACNLRGKNWPDLRRGGVKVTQCCGQLTLPTVIHPKLGVHVIVNSPKGYVLPLGH